LATFQIVLDSVEADSGFAKDKSRVYAGCDGVIANADPTTFVVLNNYSQDGSYAKDSDHVWYVTEPGAEFGDTWGYSAILIKDADPATFQLDQTDAECDAKDKNHCYSAGQVVM
jgi:hypothetical protein